jgi:hypothetical protein
LGKGKRFERWQSNKINLLILSSLRGRHSDSEDVATDLEP